MSPDSPDSPVDRAPDVRVPGWLGEPGGAGRDAPWPELTVCVAGIGVSGVAAAEVLLRLGAAVVVVDGRDGDREREQAADLVTRGAQVSLGAAGSLPAGTQLVVTSPGWRPDAPLLVQAAQRGIPVWGEVELAWRLRPTGRPLPWLALTGTNGKTTAVRMLTAMLTAAGHRAAAAGNIGTPLLDAVLAEPPYDVLAVELSSFQLHWSSSVRPDAAAVLNIAPDHLDWHSSMERYAEAKTKVWAGDGVRVYNADDPVTARLSAQLSEGPGRRVGFTLGAPAAGQLGVVEDMLVDAAFGPQSGEPTVLASVHDVRPLAPHNVANALAAAALARAFGVPASAVRDGLHRFAPEPHRITLVAEHDGVAWVDDSKATNAHAASASLAAFDSVVWVAGGLAKGASFDDLVRGAAGRLRAAVLLGADRAALAEPLARHADRIPIAEVASTDTDAMDEVVRAAAQLARPGDTVLLAPACASMDMFRDYGARGDAFAAAVHRRLRDLGVSGEPAEPGAAGERE